MTDAAPTTSPAAQIVAGGPLPRATVRLLLLAAVGLVGVISVMFVSYASGFGDPKPHHIPVAVVAPTVDADRLAASPALSVHPAADAAVAKGLVLDRKVYGAIDLTSRPATLYVANGAGHSVEAALEAVGQALSARDHLSLEVVDLVPTAPRDPNGTMEFYCVVFLALGGALGASVLSRIHGPVRSWRQLLQRTLTLVVYTAVAAGAYLLLADPIFGGLVGHAGALYLTLWFYTLVVTLAATGVSALLGTAAGLVLTLAFTVVGNPSAGGAIGRPLLNIFFRAFTPIFPHGSGLSIIRSVQYFGDRGMGSAIVCLVAWGAAGFALLAASGLRNTHTARTATTPTTASSPSPAG